MIYFVQETGRQTNYIKIGFTRNDVKKRLKALQTTSPSELKVILTTKGNQAIEKSLHKKFAKDNVFGEWFYPSKELREYINLQDDLPLDIRYKHLIDFAKFNLGNPDHYMLLVVISAIALIPFVILSPDAIADAFIPAIIFLRIIIFAVTTIAKRMNVVLSTKEQVSRSMHEISNSTDHA